MAAKGQTSIHKDRKPFPVPKVRRYNCLTIKERKLVMRCGNDELTEHNSQDWDSGKLTAKRDYLTVPIPLLQYAIQNGLIQELRIFLALKWHFHTFNLDKPTIDLLLNMLEYKSKKSIMRNIAKLKDLRWLNDDCRTNLVFIQGFEGLRQKLGLKNRAAVHLCELELIDKNQFKGFAAGAVLCSLINNQIRKRRQLELIKGGSKEDVDAIKFGYCKVANRAIATILQCSIGQAVNFKMLAKKYRYVTIRKSYIKTGVAIKDAHLFTKAYPEKAYLLSRQGDKLVLRDCDLLHGGINLYRRDKI